MCVSKQLWFQRADVLDDIDFAEAKIFGGDPPGSVITIPRASLATSNVSWSPMGKFGQRQILIDRLDSIIAASCGVAKATRLPSR